MPCRCWCKQPDQQPSPLSNNVVGPAAEAGPHPTQGPWCIQQLLSQQGVPGQSLQAVQDGHSLQEVQAHTQRSICCELRVTTTIPEHTDQRNHTTDRTLQSHHCHDSAGLLMKPNR